MVHVETSTAFGSSKTNCVTSSPYNCGQIGNLRDGKFVLAYGSEDTVDHGGEGMEEEI